MGAGPLEGEDDSANKREKEKMYEQRVKELTDDIDALRNMVNNNFNENEIMQELNAQLREKDALINERD